MWLPSPRSTSQANYPCSTTAVVRLEFCLVCPSKSMVARNMMAFQQSPSTSCSELPSGKLPFNLTKPRYAFTADPWIISAITTSSYSNRLLQGVLHQSSQLMLSAEEYRQPYPEPVQAGHVPTQEHDWPPVGQDQATGTDCNGKLRESVPDKIVVDLGSDGLQVDESGFASSYKAADSGTAAADAPTPEKEAVSVARTRSRLRSRKVCLASVAMVVLVLVTAATLGGVLGSRKTNDDNNTSSSGTSIDPSPTGTDNVPPKLIKKGSRLSAAAWRKPQGLQIFLYYQSENGTLRWSTYDETQSSFTYEGSYWGESRELVMDPEADPPANDTSFTSTSILSTTNFMVRSFRCNKVISRHLSEVRFG